MRCDDDDDDDTTDTKRLAGRMCWSIHFCVDQEKGGEGEWQKGVWLNSVRYIAVINAAIQYETRRSGSRTRWKTHRRPRQTIPEGAYDAGKSHADKKTTRNYILTVC